MPTSRKPRRPPPVPRGPRGDTVETVLTSAFRILIGEGAHALTPQRLHQDTGIARTTIYRHWPETSDLIDFMLERATGDQDTGEFKGELRHDIDVAMASLLFRFNERPVRPLFGALVEHGRHGAETDIASDYVRGLMRPFRQVVRQGIERGDLHKHDIDKLVLALTGQLLAQYIVLGDKVTKTHTRAATEQFLERYAT